MPVDANLYYHLYKGGEEGLRPPVVLIHGAGGTHLYWPAEIRRLAGYRVFAPDLPGHGKSPGRGKQTISAYADAVLEWLTALGMHSLVFIGHSMGSAVAIHLALNYPEHVLGLGLIGAGARLRVNPLLLESAANDTTFPRAVEMVVQWSFSSHTSAQLIELAGQRMASTRPSVLQGDFIACNAFDETQRISQIQRPTLILCGEEDRMTPVRNAQFLANNIPGAVLKIIPQAGHMVMLEQPQEVAKSITTFLSTLSF
ncbi:MAG: alpha/beta hydrolase [Anaerolineales bacterium]|nr:alpha/beta hydrolase [Anaerolineales bacterium]